MKGALSPIGRTEFPAVALFDGNAIDFGRIGAGPRTMGNKFILATNGFIAAPRRRLHFALNARLEMKREIVRSGPEATRCTPRPYKVVSDGGALAV